MKALQGAFNLTCCSKHGQLSWQPMLLRALFSQVLKTSKDRDCTTYLSNLFHCLIFLMGESFSLYSTGNSLVSVSLKTSISVVSCPHQVRRLSSLPSEQLPWDPICPFPEWTKAWLPAAWGLYPAILPLQSPEDLQLHYFIGTKIEVATDYDIPIHFFCVYNSRSNFVSLILSETSLTVWIPQCCSSRKCQEVELRHKNQGVWFKDFLELLKEAFGHFLTLFGWSVTQPYHNVILTELSSGPDTQTLTQPIIHPI